MHLRRLLAGDAFPASPRRRKLLEYVVEQTLSGHSNRLKAFDLALAVLGRDERFDPQNDPIVRIEVGRLRRDLEHWYLTGGRDDPIRITIPKGHYVPAFAAVEKESALPPTDLGPLRPAPRRPRMRVAAVAGLCAPLLAMGLWLWAPWAVPAQPQRAGPAVVVLPLLALSGGDGAQLLASGLTAGLIADLMPFGGLQVFAGVTSADGAPALPPAATGVPAYLVAGEVQRGSDRVRVLARLTDGKSGEVLWSQSYERDLSTADIFDVEDELSAAIIGRLAQNYGVINLHATKELARDRPDTLLAYDCVQRAFAYRRTFDTSLYPAVRSCLEDAVRRDPDYSAAWAMLAFAHLDAARFGLVEPALRDAELRAGLQTAQRAVELAPGSVVALQALAALRYGRGDFDEAERLQRRAIELNPNNPEGLAQLGWRLVARGRPDEGRQLLEDAIDRSVVVPNWYHENLAVALYLTGELERARNEAVLGKADCCGDAYAVLAIAEAALGNAAAAHGALAEAIRQAPILATDPASMWANYQVAPDVIARLNAGLARAGLVLAPPSPGDAVSTPDRPS